MANKYISYKVRVIKEEAILELVKDGIDYTKHKQVLGVYTQAKEIYGQDCKRIEFLGTQEDGQVNIIFDKVYVQEHKKDDILERFNALCEEVTQEKQQLFDMRGILEKEVDGILHSIEVIPLVIENQVNMGIYNEESFNGYKLDLVNDIIQSRTKRRSIKNRQEIISSIRLPDLKSANTLFKKYEKPFPLDKQPDNINVHTVTYTCDREKDYLMKSLSEKYTKVVDMQDGTIKYCNTLNATSPKYLSMKKATTPSERIYRYNKLPDKQKGQTYKVKYMSEPEKKHILNHLATKFNKFNLDENTKIIELINRVA